MSGSAMPVNVMYIRSHIVIPVCGGFSQPNVKTHCFVLVPQSLLVCYWDTYCPGKGPRAIDVLGQLYESKWPVLSLYNLKNSVYLQTPHQYMGGSSTFIPHNQRPYST